jgi:TRAP transporter TAXI family solute receptor
MGRRGFLVLAAMFALSAIVALSFHMATAPTVLRIAVGPIGSEDVRMAAAIVQSLNRERSSVRLKLVLTDGLKASAQKLDAGDAQLAIIRPDIGLALKGDTVLITRRFFPFFVSGRDRGIERIAELRGRKIGVVDNPAGNIDLLKNILSFYEVPLNEVTVIGLTPGEIAEAVSTRRVDAMFSVGALSARTATPGLTITRQAWGNEPVFIPIREADALASRNRTIETGEIVRGAFGGDPPRPADPLPTISVTHRLVAETSLADTVVSELTRVILAQRASLANEVPSMQGIEAPDTARDSALPVHSGTIAFLDGTERSFFDRYGDWFYLGVMAMSLLGSVGAAMLSQITGTRRRAAMGGLSRLIAMLNEARGADSIETLSGLEREADGILAKALEDMSRQAIDDSGLAAYRLAMDQLGRAVGEQRRMLLDAEYDGETAS